MMFSTQGETPAKKNSRINTRSGRSFPSARYTAWHDMAVMGLRQQAIKNNLIEPISTPVEISLTFYHSDKRRRDADNAVSSIFDTLVDAGILKDDEWKIVREYHVNNFLTDEAHCVIKIMK